MLRQKRKIKIMHPRLFEIEKRREGVWGFSQKDGTN